MSYFIKLIYFHNLWSHECLHVFFVFFRRWNKSLICDKTNFCFDYIEHKWLSLYTVSELWKILLNLLQYGWNWMRNWSLWLEVCRQIIDSWEGLYYVVLYRTVTGCLLKLKDWMLAVTILSSLGIAWCLYHYLSPVRIGCIHVSILPYIMRRALLQAYLWWWLTNCPKI